MTVPERMSLMGPPCTYSAEEHARIGRMWTRGLTLAPALWPVSVQLKGEDHPAALVTEEQVLEIRRRYDRGDVRVKIARDYGMSYQGIYSIGTRVTWKHVPEEVA